MFLLKMYYTYTDKSKFEEKIKMIPTIYDRRSIRKFKDKPISQKDITDIIQSGIKAPSSKNRQPWKYIVIQGNAKEEMLKVFRKGIEGEENDKHSSGNHFLEL